MADTQEIMTKARLGALHGRELAHYREHVIVPLRAKITGGDLKDAKAYIDILKIHQECERKACLFSDGQEADNTLEVEFMQHTRE